MTIIGAIECLKDCFYIDIVIVNKKYQNQGFGKKLTEFAVSYLQKRDGKPIRLHVKQWNKKAKKLYEKLGFVVIKKEIDWSIKASTKYKIKAING